MVELLSLLDYHWQNQEMQKVKTCFLGLTVILIGMLPACNGPEPIVKDELVSQLSSCGQSLDDPLLAECKVVPDTGPYQIWTWNLEFFPQDESTRQSFIDIVEYYQPDIIAVQEINNRYRMQEALDAMPLYEGWIVDLSGDLDMGYIYNTCTVQPIDEPGTNPDTDLWPRPAVHWTAQVNGQELNLLNIHLKCCGDGVETRTASVKKIQDYLLNKLPNDNVILLGDYNDEIEDSSLQSLRSDTVHFSFADQEIADGNSAYWSYPGWPSHIDHILVSDELFDELDTAYTLLVERCVSGYSTRVSDHRPVVARFDF